MTDTDRLIEQERQIMQLHVQNAQLQARVANLQRMHDNAQRHIGRLQKLLDKQKLTEAERVFGQG